MLLTVFIPPEHSIATLAGITSRLAPLNMGPLTRSDLCNVLINPLMEKFNPLLEYMRTEAVMTDDGVRVMSQKEIRAVIEDVAARCVRLETKVWDGFSTFWVVFNNEIGENAEEAL